MMPEPAGVLHPAGADEGPPPGPASFDGDGGGRDERLLLAQRLRGPSTVTWLFVLLLGCVHAALAWMVYRATSGAWPWWGPLPPEVLERLGAVTPDTLAAGERWRLLFSALLHHDMVHIVANVVALRALGRVYEPLAGAGQTLVVLVGGALAGAAAAAAAGELSVGASGAAMGMAGALAMAAARSRLLRPLAFRLLFFVALILVGGVLWNRWASEWAGFGVSNVSHLGGLLGGLVVGWLPPAPPARAGGRRRLAMGALVVVALSACVWLGRQGMQEISAAVARPRIMSGGPLRDRSFPAVGVTLGVPERWTTLEESRGYVAIGPAPGRPFLQLITMETRGMGTRWAVPEVIVADVAERHPDVVAAPFERRRVGGHDATRIEMVYRQDLGLEVQQIRYVVRAGRTLHQLILLGQPPMPGALERRIVGTVRFGEDMPETDE
jgi:membrane associated rhomboid family serine protease